MFKRNFMMLHILFGALLGTAKNELVKIEVTRIDKAGIDCSSSSNPNCIGSASDASKDQVRYCTQYKLSNKANQVASFCGFVKISKEKPVSFVCEFFKPLIESDGFQGTLESQTRKINKETASDWTSSLPANLQPDSNGVIIDNSVGSNSQLIEWPLPGSELVNGPDIILPFMSKSGQLTKSGKMKFNFIAFKADEFSPDYNKIQTKAVPVNSPKILRLHLKEDRTENGKPKGIVAIDQINRSDGEVLSDLLDLHFENLEELSQPKKKDNGLQSVVFHVKVNFDFLFIHILKHDDKMSYDNKLINFNASSNPTIVKLGQDKWTRLEFHRASPEISSKILLLPHSKKSLVSARFAETNKRWFKNELETTLELAYSDRFNFANNIEARNSIYFGYDVRAYELMNSSSEEQRFAQSVDIIEKIRANSKEWQCDLDQVKSARRLELPQASAKNPNNSAQRYLFCMSQLGWLARKQLSASDRCDLPYLNEKIGKSKPNKWIGIGLSLYFGFSFFRESSKPDPGSYLCTDGLSIVYAIISKTDVSKPNTLSSEDPLEVQQVKIVL